LKQYLSKLDRYIIGSIFGYFAIIFGLLMFIVIVFDISEKIDDFLSTTATLGQIIFVYYLSFIPYIGMMLAPFFFFLSMVIFSAVTANRSEFIVTISSGVSTLRLFVPFIFSAIIFSVFSWCGYHYILPFANKNRLQFENTYIKHKFRNTDRNIFIQDSPNTFVYFENYNVEDSVGYKFALEKFDSNGLLTYKLRSPRVTWNGGSQTWKISSYTSRTIGPSSEHLKMGTLMDTVLNISPKDFSRKSDYLENLTTPELKDFIASEKEKGSDMISNFEVKLYERNAYVFSIFILSVIGFSFSTKKVRGGLGLQIIKAISIGFGYIFIAKICTIYASNAGLSPLLAVWFPNILFGAYAFKLLYQLKTN